MMKKLVETNTKDKKVKAFEPVTKEEFLAQAKARVREYRDPVTSRTIAREWLYLQEDAMHLAEDNQVTIAQAIVAGNPYIAAEVCSTSADLYSRLVFIQGLYTLLP